MRTLQNVAALVAAVTILQVAGGLSGVLLPLAMSADGLSRTDVGLSAASYGLGFMAGAWAAPTILSRLGHIRLYASAAALVSVGILAMHWADPLWTWALLRMGMGAGIATLFASAESWLQSSLEAKKRGGIVGFYHLCTKAAIAIGPLFLPAPNPGADFAAEPFMIAAMFFVASLIPICATQQTQPPPPKAQPLAIGALFKTAPAAVIACVAAGLVNTGVLSLSPIFAQDRFGPWAPAIFQSCAWIGSLFVQWPAGVLSDRMDRRIVIGALSAVSGLAAIALALLPAAYGFAPAAGLFALWGATSLSFYGVAVAHMADRAEPGEMAGATSGLLFVWAAGSIAGPVIVGLLDDFWLGPNAVFWFAGFCGLALTPMMLFRRALRAPPEAVEKETYLDKQATSVAAAELAYGETAEKR